MEGLLAAWVALCWDRSTSDLGRAGRQTGRRSVVLLPSKLLLCGVGRNQPAFTDEPGGGRSRPLCEEEVRGGGRGASSPTGLSWLASATRSKPFRVTRCSLSASGRMTSLESERRPRLSRRRSFCMRDTVRSLRGSGRVAGVQFLLVVTESAMLAPMPTYGGSSTRPATHTQLAQRCSCVASLACPSSAPLFEICCTIRRRRARSLGAPHGRTGTGWPGEACG
uniref:Uncharacterized protein n=1 Tax=Ixodes ricinus TaxID=34613 RepID=A0A6B0V5R1_IXORI